MSWNGAERRIDKRIKVKPKYRVKARVKSMSSKQTHFFKINDLSLSGLKLIQQGDTTIDFDLGDSLEIMIYHKNESVKVVAQVLESNSRKDEKNSENEVRAKIIGIDQEGQKVLADFLKKIEAS